MGLGEILLILIVAVIIWGPGKIPEIARTLGKAMNTLRKSSMDLTSQITRELDEEKKAPEKSGDKPARKTHEATDAEAPSESHDTPKGTPES